MPMVEYELPRLRPCPDCGRVHRGPDCGRTLDQPREAAPLGFRAYEPDEAARRAVISWAGSGGFAAVHDAGGTVETITDDLLRFLWLAGFKIARLNDGDWF